MIELIGREFALGEHDCYALARDYFRLRFDIHLPDFARPDAFWDEGLDLYGRHMDQLGFEILHAPTHEWQEGDVILMSIMAPVANHVAIVVENGQILHHMVGRMSTVEDYRGLWRNMTTAVYRHKDVKIDRDQDEIDIRTLLPAHKRAELDRLLEQQAARAE